MVRFQLSFQLFIFILNYFQFGVYLISFLAITLYFTLIFSYRLSKQILLLGQLNHIGFLLSRALLTLCFQFLLKGTDCKQTALVLLFASA
jgi:hypothetical protein